MADRQRPWSSRHPPTTSSHHTNQRASLCQPPVRGAALWLKCQGPDHRHPLIRCSSCQRAPEMPSGYRALPVTTSDAHAEKVGASGTLSGLTSFCFRLVSCVLRLALLREAQLQRVDQAPRGLCCSHSAPPRGGRTIVCAHQQPWPLQSLPAGTRQVASRGRQ